MSVELVTPPDEEPVLIAEAAAQVRVLPDTSFSPPEYPEQAQMRIFIAAARSHCEEYTRRSLAVKTLRASFEGFPWCGELALPQGPVRTIDSITYLASDGQQATVSAPTYELSAFREPNVVRPVYGASWPSAICRPDSVIVEYTAGYDADTIPYPIKAAILLMFGHLYANREAVVTGVSVAEMPLGVKALLDPYRLEMGA